MEREATRRGQPPELRITFRFADHALLAKARAAATADGRSLTGWMNALMKDNLLGKRRK